MRTSHPPTPLHSAARAAVLLAVVVAIGLAADVGAQETHSPSESDRCAIAKLKAAHLATARRIRCERQALRKGEEADVEACLAKARRKLAKGFEEAELERACHEEANAPAVQGEIDRFVDGLVSQLVETTDPPPNLQCGPASEWSCCALPGTVPGVGSCSERRVGASDSAAFAAFRADCGRAGGDALPVRCADLGHCGAADGCCMQGQCGLGSETYLGGWDAEGMAFLCGDTGGSFAPGSCR